MKPRQILFFIFLLTSLAVFLNLPAGFPLKVNFGKINFEKKLYPLKLDLKMGALKIKKEPKTVLGLDLAGGAHLVYEAEMKDIESEDQEQALKGARNIIEKRVNLFGATEPIVRTTKTGDSKRIVVELPGVTDVEEAKKLIGKTAQLEFREFTEGTPSSFFPNLENTSPSGISGRHLKKSAVVFEPNTGEPQVSLEFNDEGAKLFEEATQRNIGRQLAVFLDEEPITAPKVNEVISGGQAVISGSFSPEEAKNLSIQLISGALPVSIKIIEEKTIGPTLGRESIEKSLRAGVIGLLLVAFFMWAYYGKLGLMANMALIIYGLLNLSIFRLIPVTLTLPSIAGFILSVGMAVDTNILIFERIKEEVRSGKPWQAAMELGFGRAWDSIRDANLTTLLTCFILFNPLNWSFLPQFGMVRGFAATLAIGVIISLFTGIIVSRNLIRVIIRTPK